MADRSRFRVDLLRARGIGAMLRSRAFPYAAQILLLLGFLALLVNAWGVGAGEKPGFLNVLRKTNLSTLLVWGLWWPMMVIGAISLGRAWCAICPMEILAHAAHRAGSRLGTARLQLPGFLKAGAGLLLLYLVLQVFVGGVSLHRNPGYTAVMMAAILSLALLSGLLFARPRSFCDALCPANLLLPVYGRLSPVEIDTVDPGVCERCTTKDCFRPDRLDRIHARSCPSRVRVFDRRKADACVLCFQCAKACPYGNVGYGIAAGAAPSRRRPVLGVAESLFLLFVSGFVMHELFTEIKPIEGIYHWPADRLHALLGGGVPWDWSHTAWYLAGFPALLWLAVTGIARLAGARGSWTEVFRHAATAAFPIVVAAHAAKGLAKLNSWAPFLPASIADPNGVETARRMVASPEIQPALLIPFPVIGFFCIALGAFFAIWAWRRIRDLPEGAAIPARVGIIAAAAVYIAVLAAWPFV